VYPIVGFFAQPLAYAVHCICEGLGKKPLHLTAGEEGRLLYRRHLGSPADWTPYQMVLDTMTRLCLDVIAAVQGYIATWRARFRQDGWHSTQWGGCCDGVNETLLEVFVTDTRQQALAAYERDAC
jgi:hypothetical protein